MKQYHQATRLPAGASLLDIADLLRQRLDVRDRKHRFKKYHKCFIASDAVTLMVEQEFAESRQDAVRLGRRLEKELSLWHHVCNDHVFKDERLFFRFASDEDDHNQSMNDFFNNMNSSIISNDSSIREGDEFLLSVADRLEIGLDIGPRRNQISLKTYRNCFTASEAVDYMIDHDMAESRDEAVLIGRRLEKELEFWHCVRPGQGFCDEKNVIFRLKCSSQHDEPNNNSIARAHDSTDSLLSPRSRGGNNSMKNTISQLLNLSPTRSPTTTAVSPTTSTDNSDTTTATTTTTTTSRQIMAMRRLLQKGTGQRGGDGFLINNSVASSNNGSSRPYDDDVDVSEEIITLESSQFDRLSAQEKAKLMLMEFGIAGSSYTAGGYDESYYEED